MIIIKNDHIKIINNGVRITFVEHGHYEPVGKL